MKCPFCGIMMEWNDVAKQFYCPKCMYETKKKEERWFYPFD